MKAIPLALLLTLASTATVPAQEKVFPELFLPGTTATSPLPNPFAARFGRDAAIDGDFIAVALPEYVSGGETRGAVEIFKKTGNPFFPTWTYLQRFIGGPVPRSFIDNTPHPSLYAKSIAMRDGVLAVGRLNFGTFPLESNLWSLVEFYRYNESLGEYVDAGARVISETGAKAGESISISGDLVVVGSSGSHGAFCFRWVEGSGFLRFQTIPRPGGALGLGDPSLTSTHAVSLDGNRLALGAPRTSSSRGAVYTYLYNGSTFVLETELTPDSGASNQYFGDSVIIRGDSLAVSAPTTGKGAVYVYKRALAGWDFVAKLSHSAATASNVRQGISGLELSDDGKSLLAGCSPNLIVSWQLGEDGTWHEGASFPVLNTPEVVDIALQGNQLIASSIQSQHVQTFIHDDSNSSVFANDLRSRLYHEEASDNPLWQSEHAAFRYKLNHYEVDQGVVVRTADSGTSEFGAPEQARVDQVLAELEALLDLNPFATDYHDIYLDIIHDLAQLKFITAQDALVDLDRARLDPPPPGQDVIGNEIGLYETSLATLRDAIRIVIDALDADIAFTPEGEPAGFHFFKTRVPLRPLMPVRYLNNGIPTPLENNGVPITAPLVDGYKDAILFFEMLSEYGNSAAALAHLYYLDGSNSDAFELLQDARALIFVHAVTIRGMFQDPATGSDPTQLAQSIAKWELALNEIKGARDRIENGLNPLGFDNDFLVLLQRADGDDQSIFNTFNILSARIDNLSSNSNLLHRAEQDRLEALAAYANYRGGLDELELGLISVNNDARNRLVQLVGYDYIAQRTLYDTVPGPNFGPNGGFVTGSELWDQFQNIRRARIQIERNGQEILNLEEKVRIEAARVGDINSIRVNYAEQRATMENEIGRINAAQKYTEVLAQAANPANWIQGVANAINGGMQIYAELRKGELAAERERMAAQEQAEVENTNSDALIATMLLDMKTLVLSSQESAVILQQEVGRLTGLLREKNTLELRIESHGATLGNRYFADPVHRLRYLNELLIANRTFEAARETVFLMARALEYKWNITFDTFLSGQDTNMASIFRARNAQELQAIVDDMRAADGTNIGTQDIESQFSLKEDAFGFAEIVDGQPATYPDPRTGLPVDATNAFQGLLETEFMLGNPNGNLAILRIPFSTVRDPLNSFFGPNFFRGPRGLVVNPDGSLTVDPTFGSKGRFRDKIDRIAVTMPGTYRLNGNTWIPVETSCELRYSGTGFMRTRTLGRYAELLDETDGNFRFDRLSEELTAIPTRASTFLNGGWQTTDTQLSAPAVALTDDVWPARAVAPAASDFTDTFRERSVASNGWEIRITLKDGQTFARVDQISDIILHIRHKASVRE